MTPPPSQDELAFRRWVISALRGMGLTSTSPVSGTVYSPDEVYKDAMRRFVTPYEAR